MDLTPYVETVEKTLAATAAAGDRRTVETAGLLAVSLEAGVRLELMHALADFAAEVTAVLEDRVVEVTLDGADVEVSVSRIAVEPHADERDGPADWTGDTSRITLRLPEDLKTAAERAAGDARLSLNAWLVGAVRGELGRTAAAEQTGHVVRGWITT